MKATVYEKFGSFDELQLREVVNPTPGDDEVLVRIHAASVNSWDVDLVRGKPFIARLGGGLFKPAHPILGADIAGRIEAVGKHVRRFKAGDEVFGDISGSGWGGFAEYTAVGEDALALKSPKMSFAQAAAIPHAGLLALQSLRGNQTVAPGDKVLINGAGGGAGTFAIQIGKLLGAEMTGVDSAGKRETMRAVGADHVIDYAEQDFTRSGRRYDLIVDMVAQRSVFDYARALTPTGRLVMVGGRTPLIFQVVTLGTLMSRFGTRTYGVLAWRRSTDDLDHMRELFEAGHVTPVIDRTFPLAETAQAVRHVGEGHAKGKVIVTMGREGEART